MNKLLESLRVSARVEQGPLGPYIRVYAAKLHSEGYARHSSCVKVRLVGDFSRWLSQKSVAADKVVAQHTVNYLRYRKRCGYRPGLGDSAALARLLQLLRDQSVIGPQLLRMPRTPG
jgi:hypothetical protein